MKLNDAQIQALFDFTKKKLVPYYDLQIELVDHLASTIEEKLEKDKKLTFETALQQVYQDFGIFGFSQIVREKEKQLSKKHFRMWWKEVVLLFRWPQIIGLATIFAFIFTLSNMVNLQYLRIAFGFLTLVAFVFGLILFMKKRKTKKKLLLLQYYQPGIISYWSYIHIQFLLQYREPQSLVFTSVNFVLIVALMASLQLNKKLKMHAMELYPEVF